MEVKMFDKAIKLIHVLAKHGYQAVYAGGCVRDMLMGNEPNDIDIATNAEPDAVEGIFKLNGYKTIPVGKQFGVIVVVVGGVEFEIATFRNDGNYSDGRRPDSVEFSSIEEDCKRRDFTINGMYFDPIKKEVIDLVGGKEDLENKVIRFIGNADDRINEDSLRIIRAIRFASRFGFEFDYETSLALERNSCKINTVSAERISSEMEKMFKNKNRIKAMEKMVEYRLLPDPITNFNTFYNLTVSNPSINLCWACFIDGAGNYGIHDKEAILREYKLSNKQIKSIIGILSDAPKVLEVMDPNTGEINKALMKRLWRNEWVLDAVEFTIANGTANMSSALVKVQQFQKMDKEYLWPTQLITGDDLISLGVEKGPIFRDIKIAIENAQLNEEISTKEDAIKIVKEMVHF
jgi:tRNA nucleotidyltransferase/poly(A) polymerase